MTPMGGDLAMLPTHAHFNLFGWTTLSLYGLIHNAFPALGRQRLGRVQFGLAVLGAIALPLGFGVSRASAAHNALVGAGAISGAVAAVIFAVMFFRAEVFSGRSPQR